MQFYEYWKLWSFIFSSLNLVRIMIVFFFNKWSHNKIVANDLYHLGQNVTTMLEEQKKQGETIIALEIDMAYIKGMKKNEDKVLNGLLSTRGLDNISKDEVITLKADVKRGERNIEDEVIEAVHDAVTKVETSNGFATRAVKSQHEVDTAVLKATVDAQVSEISFLQDAVDSYKSQIEAAREAQIQIETNRSVADMVVQTGKL